MEYKGEEGFGSGGFVKLLEEGGGDMDVGGFLNMGEGEGGGGELVQQENLFLRYPPPPLSLSSSSSGSYYSSRMLCFGGEESFLNGFSQKPSIGGSETSTSTSSSSSNSSLSKTKKSGDKGGRSVGGGATATPRGRTAPTTAATTSAAKKPKKEQQKQRQQNTTSHGGGGATKVRKEKLGDRIMALQQLVSPFGKSDTASVLHEALGYIKFLHDQVQVLSSPYLQQLPSSAHLPGGGEGGMVVGSRNDLRSRGLCLVPISCTAHVADSNGADLWSPGMGSSVDWCNGDPAIPKH